MSVDDDTLASLYRRIDKLTAEVERLSKLEMASTQRLHALANIDAILRKWEWSTLADDAHGTDYADALKDVARIEELAKAVRPERVK